jgi:hypothetical protein
VPSLLSEHLAIAAAFSAAAAVFMRFTYRYLVFGQDSRICLHCPHPTMFFLNAWLLLLLLGVLVLLQVHLPLPGVWPRQGGAGVQHQGFPEEGVRQVNPASINTQTLLFWCEAVLALHSLLAVLPARKPGSHSKAEALELMLTCYMAADCMMEPLPGCNIARAFQCCGCPGAEWLQQLFVAQAALRGVRVGHDT